MSDAGCLNFLGLLCRCLIIIIVGYRIFCVARFFLFFYVDCMHAEYLQRLCLIVAAGLGFLSDIGFKQANGGGPSLMVFIVQLV